MLKFPHSIDQIDPLSRHDWEEDWCSPTWPHPISERHKDEWCKAADKENGADWRVIGDCLYRNSRGQFRYAPPLPPVAPPAKAKCKFPVGMHIEAYSGPAIVIETYYVHPRSHIKLFYTPGRGAPVWYRYPNGHEDWMYEDSVAKLQ